MNQPSNPQAPQGQGSGLVNAHGQPIGQGEAAQPPPQEEIRVQMAIFSVGVTFDTTDPILFAQRYCMKPVPTPVGVSPEGQPIIQNVPQLSISPDSALVIMETYLALMQRDQQIEALLRGLHDTQCEVAELKGTEKPPYPEVLQHIDKQRAEQERLRAEAEAQAQGGAPGQGPPPQGQPGG